MKQKSIKKLTFSKQTIQNMGMVKGGAVATIICPPPATGLSACYCLSKSTPPTCRGCQID